MKIDPLQFFDIKPNLGYDTPEWSLSTIIYEYYSKHMSEEKARMLTERYIGALLNQANPNPTPIVVNAE